jgi:hypothetical protein
MENLLGILHRIQWIMFHSLTGFASSHLKEMSLTQTQETMTLQNLTPLDLFSFIVTKGPHKWDGKEVAFGWEPCCVHL